MRPPVIVCALLLLGALGASSAEDYTLSRCLELSREKSVDAVQAILDEQGAKAAAREAGSARLPKLLFSGQLLRSDNATTNLPDDNNATLALEQRLLPYSSAWTRARQQGALYKAAVLAKVETQQDVDLAVKRLYFSILQSSDDIAGIQAVDVQFRRLLETVLPKYTIGHAPAFDPVKVRVALADLARDRGALEAQLSEQRQTLALVMGLPDGVALALTPLRAFPDPPADGFAASALAFNPTLKTQAKRIEAAQFGVRAAQALRYPDVVGHLDYNYAAQATSLMTPGWTASVALRMPIFDWGGISAQVRQERVAVDKARAQLEADRQSALSSLAGSLAQAKAHREDYRRYLDLVASVHEIAVAGVARYRRGASSILEATDGVNLWLNTLAAERAAYYGYLSDLAQLERLSGEEPYKPAYER